MSTTLDEAVIDFLEEIPLEEMLEEGAQTIVRMFRSGAMGVTEAIALLNEDCTMELQQYVETNNLLSKAFEEVEDDD